LARRGMVRRGKVRPSVAGEVRSSSVWSRMVLSGRVRCCPVWSGWGPYGVGKEGTLTVSEVARILEVKETTVYALCRERLLGHRRIGVGRGTIRISRADLDAYIESSRVETRARPPEKISGGTGLVVRSITGEAMAQEERRAESARRRRRDGSS
jgi:excisionase family DNA binding protein